jgi:hypothetical protein
MFSPFHDVITELDYIVRLVKVLILKGARKTAVNPLTTSWNIVYRASTDRTTCSSVLSRIPGRSVSNTISNVLQALGFDCVAFSRLMSEHGTGSCSRRQFSSSSKVCNLVAKVHHKHVIRRNKPECVGGPSACNLTFGLWIPANSANSVCYTQEQCTGPALFFSLLYPYHSFFLPSSSFVISFILFDGESV